MKNIKKYDMLEEIRYQSELCALMLEDHVDFYGEKINFDISAREKNKLRKIKKFIFLGCGSSANAGILAMYYFEEFSGIDCEFEYADEFISRRAVMHRNTAVVLLSQSGKSKDVVRASEIARARGALIISICNTKGSLLDRSSDISIVLRAGKERAMAATKSFFAQVFSGLLFSFFVLSLHGKRMSNKKEIFLALKRFVENVDKVLAQESEVKKIAKRVKNKKNIIVTGRKYNFPIALEGAHKIKETAYIHAEGMASEELRHGGEAMIDRSFLVVSMIPGDTVYKDNLRLAKELHKIKSYQVLISDKNLKTLRDLSNALINIPKTHEILTPLLNLIIYQFLAYYLATEKEIDISKPRNIKKFVA